MTLPNNFLVGSSELLNIPPSNSGVIVSDWLLKAQQFEVPPSVFCSLNTAKGFGLEMTLIILIIFTGAVCSSATSKT